MLKISLLCIITIVICFFIEFTLCGHRVRRIVGGIPADIPPPDDPVVFVKYNGKFARIEGVRNPTNYHYHFRGIRYAEAPIGKQRFQPPKAHTLEGDVNATRYPPPCPQPLPGTDMVIGNEDCLFLNVFTPELPDASLGLNVIVWVHGGGFRYGSASQYNVQNLVNKKVIVVTIQYRLGSLGFLSSGDRDLPGNAGLFDIMTAIRWTKNYIGFFGGNPNRIHVMGQGTGASASHLLAMSNIVRGLSSVIAMSGTAVSNWAVDRDPKNKFLELVSLYGCPTTTTIVIIGCLRQFSTEDIIRTDSEIETTYLKRGGFLSGLSGLLTPSPVSEGKNDGRSLPGLIEQKPLDALTEGNIPSIPLLTGVTRDETGRAVQENFNTEIKDKLENELHFLDQVLLKKLQDRTGLNKKNSQSSTNNPFWSVFDPSKFSNYVSVAANTIVSKLAKVTEMTADALFNLPAFLTASTWSSKNNLTYLYQFEHVGKSYKGFHFLKGVPFIGNSSKADLDNIISHGDELAYLFKPQNIDGTPLSIEVQETEDDKKVRAIFTNMIYSFVKYGKIEINNKVAPPFTNTSNNCIGISATPRIITNFRFCEIGLWAGLTDRLKNNACSFFSAAQKAIIDTFNSTGISDPFGNFEKTIPKFPGNFPINPGFNLG